jgi:hypothetical protein
VAISPSYKREFLAPNPRILSHQSTVKIDSGVGVLGDGKNKKEKGSGGNGMKKYYKNAQICFISYPCSEDSNDAMFTRFGTIGNTCLYVLISVNVGCYRLKGGHFEVVQNLPCSLSSVVGLTMQASNDVLR